MSDHLIDLLTRMGHDVNKPIVVKYDDGTSTTLPSLADVVAEQEEAIRIGMEHYKEVFK